MGTSYNLFKHQLVAINRAKLLDTFALFMEVGTGKTAAAIRILADKMNDNRRNLRTLIFAPPVVLPNWKREILKFSDIDSRAITLLNGTGKSRIETLKKRKTQIYITNYESLLMPELFQEMVSFAPEFLILDESQRIKNPTSKRTKAAIKLSDYVKYKLILTGTPILNSPQDLWAQFRALDAGATFGQNFFAFRSKYFYDKNAGMNRHTYFPMWTLLPKSLDAFNDIIHEKAAIAKKEECLDLPALVKVRIETSMSPDQAKAYKEMEKDYIAFVQGGAVMADLAITKALRLQQIVSGFATLDDTNATQITFKSNPRSDTLHSLLEDILEDPESKVIVWAVFKKNYSEIAKVCDELGVKYVALHGEVSPVQRQANIDSFNSDPNTRVFIGHPGAGGVGINLVVASYCVFYSRNFSLEFDIQAEARNYRFGTNKKVTRFDLYTPNTIDELILQRLESKVAVTDRVLKDIAKELANGNFSDQQEV